jgi:hypothetical protein
VPDQSSHGKLFGKYQEVVLLVLGFILTTIVGGFLADRVQRRAWIQQHQIQICESEQDARIKGFAQLSDRMDTRLLRMRELAWALEHAKNLRDVEQERKLNREARDDWSSRVNSTLAFTQVYFGSDYYNTLYDLNTGFGDLFAKFNPIFDSGKPDPKAAHEIEDALDGFNPKVYAFDLAMQQTVAARTGNSAVPK